MSERVTSNQLFVQGCLRRRRSRDDAVVKGSLLRTRPRLACRHYPAGPASEDAMAPGVAVQFLLSSIMFYRVYSFRMPKSSSTLYLFKHTPNIPQLSFILLLAKPETDCSGLTGVLKRRRTSHNHKVGKLENQTLQLPEAAALAVLF